MINFTDSFKKKIVVIVFVAVFFSLIWPFTSFNLHVGNTDLTINPADGLPVLLGFMFGSSGAIGCALGAVGPELFDGTLSPATIGTALGYFCLAYAPYKVWAVILKKEDENIFLVKKPGDVLAYVITGIMGSLLCSLPVALANDVWYQEAAFSAAYLISVVQVLISVLTFGLVLYAVLSAFNMFGLAKTVKKYPLKTMIHMITLTIWSAIVLVFSIATYFFVDTGPRNPWIVVPVTILGLLMLIDLTYGGKPPEIVDKPKKGKKETKALAKGQETKLLAPPADGSEDECPKE